MPTGTNGSELHPTVLELARKPNYAAFTTFPFSGYPQTHMIWVGTNGEHLLVDTEVHRQQFHNAQRNPKVTLIIRGENDPYRYVEVRGEVVGEVRGPEARELIDVLAHKCHGGPYKNPIQSERVMLRIAPLRQLIFAEESDAAVALEKINL